jgi:hypothetical protein
MNKQTALGPAAAPPGADAALHDFDVLAWSFVEAFNERDADALVALAHPRIVFRPTSLVARRRTYHGHAGLRRWVGELDALGLDLHVQIREIRPLSPNGFLVLSKLHVTDELLADSAMIACLADRKIVEAHSYLSDEHMLVRLGLIPDAAAAAAVL